MQVYVCSKSPRVKGKEFSRSRRIRRIRRNVFFRNFVARAEGWDAMVCYGML